MVEPILVLTHDSSYNFHMFVKSVHLRSFKRFTDFTISDLPNRTRLVVLTGPNGTGKSAIAEAFNYLRRARGGFGIRDDVRYFTKVADEGAFPASRHISIEFHDREIDADGWRKAIYLRSANRHQADFDSSQIGKMPSQIDEPGLGRLVELEQKVHQNYQRIVSRSVNDLYDAKNDSVSGRQIRDRIVGKLQAVMTDVFGDLQLESPGNPFEDGTFFFTKGTAKKFRYPNLSSGEKAAFDLILDFVLATDEFTDAVYWLDEPELHLGSRVQGKLLDAFLAHLPEDCQLWLATHSLGMMRRALSLSRAHAVCFLDTTGLNLDETAVLSPATPDRSFWKNALEIALDDMAALVAPETVVLCEGANAETGFDAMCYRKIFASTHPEVEFVSIGNSKEVKKGGPGIADAIGVVAEGTKVLRLVDGDDHTEQERLEYANEGVRVLSWRTIENYLLSDEILAKLCHMVSKTELVPDLITARREAIGAAGAPADDFKKARQVVHMFARNRLHVPNPGSTGEIFLRDILAPLVTPDTASYSELHTSIFGEAARLHDSED